MSPRPTSIPLARSRSVLRLSGSSPITLRAGVWQSCYDDPAHAASTDRSQVGVHGVAFGVGDGRTARAKLEGALQTEHVRFPRRPLPSLLWHPALSCWGGAAKGALSTPLRDTAVRARRGWGWFGCTGGCRQRDPGAGRCHGAGVDARGELTQGILGAG